MPIFEVRSLLRSSPIFSSASGEGTIDTGLLVLKELLRDEDEKRKHSGDDRPRLMSLLDLNGGIFNIFMVEYWSRVVAIHVSSSIGVSDIYEKLSRIGGVELYDCDNVKFLPRSGGFWEKAGKHLCITVRL